MPDSAGPRRPWFAIAFAAAVLLAFVPAIEAQLPDVTTSPIETDLPELPLDVQDILEPPAVPETSTLPTTEVSLPAPTPEPVPVGSPSPTPTPTPTATPSPSSSTSRPSGGGGGGGGGSDAGVVPIVSGAPSSGPDGTPTGAASTDLASQAGGDGAAANVDLARETGRPPLLGLLLAGLVVAGLAALAARFSLARQESDGEPGTTEDDKGQP